MRPFFQIAVAAVIMATGIPCLDAVALETLADLQIDACENRALVRRYQAQAGILETRVAEARSMYLPSLDVDYTLNRLNHNTTLGELRNTDRFSAGVTWNLFSGFKRRHDLASAQLSKKAADLETMAIQQDICLNTALAFLSVHRAMENLSVARAEVQRYEDRLRQVDLKVAVGVLKKTDRLRIRVERDNALQGLRRAESAVTEAVNLLSFETGRPVERESLDFSLFETLPPQKDPGLSMERIRNHRSDIQAMELSIQAAGRQIDSARAEGYPRADLYAGYAAYNAGENAAETFSFSDDELRCQAILSLNLYDGGRRKAAATRASETRRTIKMGMQEAIAGLETRLNNILADQAVAFDNLGVARAGVAEAQENLRITDLAFEQGIGTSTDVLDAIFNLSRARFNVISARTRVFENHFQLQRLVDRSMP